MKMKMKQTILGTNIEIFASQLKKRKIIAVATVVIIICLNVLFCILRNENNHYLMLGLNIAVDILGLWFLIGFVSFKIAPRSALIKMYRKRSTAVTCVIMSVSDETTRVQGFDCFKITVEGDTKRTLFLPDVGAISLNAGDRADIYAVSGIIVEVEYE